MTQAKKAAGDQNVLVHGAGTTQVALAAGALDELEPIVIPVLFDQGRRLFEGSGSETRTLPNCAETGLDAASLSRLPNAT